jgi:hypothetical protein
MWIHEVELNLKVTSYKMFTQAIITDVTMISVKDEVCNKMWTTICVQLNYFIILLSSPVC